MSLNMQNLLTHMHHNKLPKEYQAKEDSDAIRVSEYWGKKSNQIQSPKISFEFFPPRSDSAKESLKETYIKLNSINPKHYSVTFGANGKSQDATFDTIVNLSEDTSIPLTPHLTCVDTKKAQVTELIDKYISHGVTQVMVLKGDRPSKPMYKGDFKYANEMVKFIKEHYDNLDILVAAYPEKHPHSMNVGSDIDFFVHKVNSGATEAITQYFYNIDAYFYFIDELQKRNIDIPITPGIMPITNFEQLTDFSKTCGAEIPSWIFNRLKLYRNDPKSLKNFGQDVVSQMCLNLKENGVDRFHFYSMNKAEPVFSIANAIM